MDFIFGLPKTSSGYDSIWVIVDWLTKSAHFLLVKITYPVTKYSELYLIHIVCLHGVPKTIVSDRGPQFIAQFWEELHKAMGTSLMFSTTYRLDQRSNREGQPNSRRYAESLCSSI